MKRLKGILCLMLIVLMTSINQVDANSVIDGLEEINIKLLLENGNERKELDTKIYGNSAVMFFNSKDLEGIIETDEEYVEIRDLRKKEDIFVSYTGNGYRITKKTTKRDYDWYYSQQESGFYKDINCGPTVAVMAVKWNNKNYSITPEEARNGNIAKGRGWPSYNVVDFIEEAGGSSYIEEYSQISNITEQIDKGNILIAGLNFNYMRQSNMGHYIIIHDYVERDGRLYFIAHDPGLRGRKIEGEFMGKNIEYNSKNVDAAIKNWWSYLIVVENQMGE